MKLGEDRKVDVSHMQFVNWGKICRINDAIQAQHLMRQAPSESNIFCGVNKSFTNERAGRTL
jgi:hypothetical protein